MPTKKMNVPTVKFDILLNRGERGGHLCVALVLIQVPKSWYIMWDYLRDAVCRKEYLSTGF